MRISKPCIKMQMKVKKAKMSKKPNWFIRGICIYIVIIAVWGGWDTFAQKQENASKFPEEKISQNHPVTSEKYPEIILQKYSGVADSEYAFVGMASVTSGVTFHLVTPVDEHWRKRITRRVRLYGVDTCTPRQIAKYNGQEWPCDAVTTAWLVSKTLGQEIVCKPALVKSGVTYAQCFVNGMDLAENGLASGMLLIEKDANSQAPAQYFNLEKLAKSKKLGLWSSEFADPASWRLNNGSYNPFKPDQVQ